MQYYPIYMDLRGRSCVVVGGDLVAQQKVEGLLAAGARVTVVSPSLTDGLAALAETHEILHHPRHYRPGDLTGAVLALATVDGDELHAAMAAEAAQAGVLLNVVDRPRYCSFIAPAVLRRGAVAVAISTGGASPALAKRLRRDLEQAVGDEYGLAATILGKLRPRITAAESDAANRARIYDALLAAPFLETLRGRDRAAIDALLTRVVGPGTTLEALEVELPHAPARRLVV